MKLIGTGDYLVGTKGYPNKLGTGTRYLKFVSDTVGELNKQKLSYKP